MGNMFVLSQLSCTHQGRLRGKKKLEIQFVFFFCLKMQGPVAVRTDL